MSSYPGRSTVICSPLLLESGITLREGSPYHQGRRHSPFLGPFTPGSIVKWSLAKWTPSRDDLRATLVHLAATSTINTDTQPIRGDRVHEAVPHFRCTVQHTQGQRSGSPALPVMLSVGVRTRRAIRWAVVGELLSECCDYIYIDLLLN